MPKSVLLTMLALTILTACRAPDDFIPYVGRQKRWTTSAGGFASTWQGVTIYHQLPAAPYEIVGRLTLVNADDHQVARAALQHTADGAIIRHIEPFSGGSVETIDLIRATPDGPWREYQTPANPP